MAKAVGFKVPTRPTCPEHTAPFRAIADAFFHKVSRALWIACRSGAKTRNASLLHHANSTFKDNCWTFHSSTLGNQATRCRTYVDRYFDLPHMQPLRSGRSTIKVRHYRTGAVIEFEAGTIGQFSGPKSQVVFLDEVDYMRWENLQQAIGIGHSDHGIPALMIFGSTRSRIFGSMSRLSEAAEDMGIVSYLWCVFDVMSPCPIKANTCPLWEDCHGVKCQNPEGFLDPYEVFTFAALTDRETWESQYLCERPSRRGLVFDTFEPTIHINAAKATFVPSQPVYLAADWGYSNPAAILFAQDLLGEIRVFDEIYQTRKLTATILDMTLRKLQTYGARPVAGWGDQEDPEANIQFRRGIPGIAWHGGEIEILPRLRAVRERLKSAAGPPTLFFSPKCRNTIREFSLYHCKPTGMIDAGGEMLYSDEPEDSDDHAMSALGMLCYGLRRGGRVTMRDVERLTRPDPTHPANAPWPTARPRQIKSTRF